MKDLPVSLDELKGLLAGAISAYADATQDAVLKRLSFSELPESGLRLGELLDLADATSDPHKASVLKRMIAAKLVLQAREHGSGFDVKSVWPLIHESLVGIESADIISSIGSQGFLAIPLYRLDRGSRSFEFLRLHIWHDSLSELMNQEKVRDFAIHSHQFHTNSWILAGEVYNTRVKVETSESPGDLSLFEIHWNNTKNEVNRRTSVAMNTGVFCTAVLGQQEAYRPGDIYQIPAGEYHKARVNNALSLSATVFLFSTHESRVPASYVVGPSEIDTSEVNRKVHVDPGRLLRDLDGMLRDE